jgi:4-amino-4-deoxy-L-arabinose transferase-like glycosyltransferase
VGALVIAHIALATVFAAITPYRAMGTLSGVQSVDRTATFNVDIGAPDERAHVNYVQRLLDGKGVPVFDAERSTTDKTYRTEAYEFHQPPLYYGLAAAWCKVVGAGNLYDPAVGLRLRVLNALIGGTTVLGTFFAALWGFKRVDLSLGAALFPALLPMNIALSGAISNDPLLFALMTWAVALMARAVRDGWTMKLAIAVGVLCGLATLTKTNGLALLPVALVAVLVPQVKRVSWREFATALAIVALLIGPWFARNARVYGDPLATNVFSKAFADTAQKSTIETLVHDKDPSFGYWTDWVGWWTARSFVGVFGYMDIWLNESGLGFQGPWLHSARSDQPQPGEQAPNALYRLVLAAFALLTLGWLVSLKEDWARKAKSVTVVNLTLVVVVLVMFFRFENEYFQAQARYIYPALAPISIGFASGAVTIFKKRPAWILGALCAGLLALDAVSILTISASFPDRILHAPPEGYGQVTAGVQ